MSRGMKETRRKVGDLTQKQQAVLTYMEQQAKLRYPPVRKVAAYFDIAVGTAYDHIQAIRRKGHLKQAGK